ncbi:MAG: glycosyl transferase group 1 [Phycisphaerales bacterium]|nr:glycosyl transferase group 1 [Phycisphaerales bacterium]
MTDPTRPPPSTGRTYLTVVGDPNDPAVWSSTPYHVLAEGRWQGVFEAGLPLQPASRAFAARRVAWNLVRVARGRRPGGFQFSPWFLERLWSAERDRVRGGRVVNHFQLYPPSVVADRSVERWYYLDATVRLLMDHYGDDLEPRWAADVLRRERDGYQSAAGVMTMSRFAADSVVRDYGVDPARVHVVVPGANLTAEVVDAFDREAVGWRDPATGRPADRSPGDPPRLVFVGRAVVRKGLDRLLRALRIARGRGGRATLRVIGLSAADVTADLRDVPGVEWVGLVSRRTDTMRFCRLVAECDVGCLLSRQEMAGISLLEFIAFGLAVIGPRTGGSPDLMSPASSVMVAPEATDEELAAVLQTLDSDRPAWAARRAAAWAARRDVLWGPAVRRMGELFAAAAG